MLSRSFARRCQNAGGVGGVSADAGGPYRRWPWPVQLPLKKKWYTPLSTRMSIADDTRRMFVAGDILLLSVVAFAGYRMYTLHLTGAYQTHLSHLTNHPPAIIANDFDFKHPENNRTLTRAQLDEYRDEVVRVKAARTPIETVIFKY